MGDFAAARYPETDKDAFDVAYSQRIPNELYLIASRRGLAKERSRRCPLWVIHAILRGRSPVRSTPKPPQSAAARMRDGRY
jgi:hypothetical protein